MKDSPLMNERRGAVSWMAGHSVAANLVMLICLVGGVLMMMFNIQQEVFPDMELDMVVVSVDYPGASPEEVEEGILLVVEEAVHSLDGVDEVTSVAREGSGSVSVELLIGADVQTVAQDIQSEVDRITTFPDEIEQPRVRIASHQRPVLDVIVCGDVPDTVLHEVGEEVRTQLLSNPSVSQVEVTGLPSLEIKVEISQENLRRYGLTVQDVADRLKAASVDLPGGGLKTANGEILVRLTERRETGREFALLPIITTADGSCIRLGDIATIDDSFAETDRYSRYDGNPAVFLEVLRVGDQTPIEVSDACRAELENITQTLPPGMKVAIHHDRSDIYRQRVQLLVKNGALGLVLVLVVLGVFLEARLAFWVMMGIPISFLGSFLLLPATGVTINMISLFAYIIALGIVVDDAIVVGENVYHYRQSGMKPLAAAIRGAKDVATPVTFSILTNMVAFMPIYLVPGMMGKIFKMIPIVVCLVFLISLGESLFVLPSHLGHQGERRRRGLSAWIHARQQAFSHAFVRWVREMYGPVLEWTLHHRTVTITLSMCILLASGAYIFSGRMGFQNFPSVESDFAKGTVTLQYGAPVAKTDKVVQRMEAAARKVAADCGREDLIEAVIANIGTGGSHGGVVRVELADVEVRDEIMSTEEFTRRWRQAVGEVVGAESVVFRSDSGGPGGRGRPVTVQLTHRDMGVLEKASRDLADVVATYPLTRDVDDGFQPGKPQMDFTLTPAGRSLGLTATDVARQVRSAFYGAEAIRQQRGRSEIKLKVRLPLENRTTEQTLHDMMVRTPDGAFVPLREVARMERGRAYNTIDRRNGQRVVQVSSDVIPKSKAGEVLTDLKDNTLVDLQERYPGLRYSFEGHQADMTESLGSLLGSSALAMLAIYVLLAIPFRSYLQPMIVMVSIPFGVVGAMLGHLIMGYSLCLPSVFGIVALAGVVVNDSLVLVDYANRRRREGLSCHDAVAAAGVQRFRPVLLTTLTTFGGLAPMILETSRQARFLIPMAISLGFGILFATFITLVIVPSLYMAVEDSKLFMAKFWPAAFGRFAQPDLAGEPVPVMAED